MVSCVSISSTGLRRTPAESQRNSASAFGYLNNDCSRKKGAARWGSGPPREEREQFIESREEGRSRRPRRLGEAVAAAHIIRPWAGRSSAGGADRGRRREEVVSASRSNATPMPDAAATTE